MKFIKAAKLAAVGSIAALALSACAANEAGDTAAPSTADGAAASLSGELNGVGASSMAPAQEAWSITFQQQHPNVTVNYDPAGSGTGRETFQNGASAFAGSDRAFKTSELAGGEFAGCAANSEVLEFPVYISPIAIIFNVTGVDSLQLDAPTIAKIFTGQIKQWNDPQIASQNPGANLPDTAITAVHRSDKSGTTGNFTDYLHGAAGSDWTAGAVEEWPSELGGEAAQGTSGVVEAVQNGSGTIGYVDASRAGDFSSVNVKVGSEYVTHTPAAAAKIVDASPVEEGRGPGDIAITIKRDSTDSGVYPIVLVSYAIACSEYADPEVGELTKAYLSYIVSAEGQNLAAERAGSAPLSAEMQAKIAAIISGIK